jgi:hypothetical protein
MVGGLAAMRPLIMSRIGVMLWMLGEVRDRGKTAWGNLLEGKFTAGPSLTPAAIYRFSISVETFRMTQNGWPAFGLGWRKPRHERWDTGFL